MVPMDHNVICTILSSSYQFSLVVDTSHIGFSLQKPLKFNPCINQPQGTFSQAYTITCMERRWLASNIFDIVNNLRPKFDIDKENVGVRKDGNKHKDPENEVLTIKRPRKRYERREIDNDIEVLSRNLLSINFSL